MKPSGNLKTQFLIRRIRRSKSLAKIYARKPPMLSSLDCDSRFVLIARFIFLSNLFANGEVRNVRAEKYGRYGISLQHSRFAQCTQVSRFCSPIFSFVRIRLRP